MAKVVAADKFAEEIQKIMEQYGDDIDRNISEAVKAVTKAGVKAIKAGSRAEYNRTGKYAKGWTSKVTEGRLETEGVIYNKNPGLPHLLEHGHLNRNGKRTFVEGNKHIKPVETQVIEQFEEKVVRSI